MMMTEEGGGGGLFGIPCVPNFLYAHMETALQEMYKINSIRVPERFLPLRI